MQLSFCPKFTPYLLLLLAADLVFAVAATQQWYTANDGLKYFIETDLKFNYFQAIDECARKDLQLVVIDSAEKNTVIVDLLQSLSEKPRFLWLDQHDEFNKEISQKRDFYSISNGLRNTFGYWDTNEPSNRDGNEHCAEMLKTSDYKWNDINCDAPFHGYICEEHHLITSNKLDLDERRNLTHLTHTITTSDFESHSKEINEISVKTRDNTNTIMNVWKKTVDQINSDLPEEDKKKAYDKVTTETLQAMEGALLSAEKDINRIIAVHAARLESDIKFIDGVLSN